MITPIDSFRFCFFVGIWALGLLWLASCFSCWQAFVIQGLLTLRMFRSMFPLTLMMISFTRRKNVQRVKYQSEYIQNPLGSLASSYVVSWQFVSHSDQLDPSTAASATVVWRGLIIIVGGWFVQQPQSFKMNLSLTRLVDNVIDTKLHVTE